LLECCYDWEMEMDFTDPKDLTLSQRETEGTPLVSGAPGYPRDLVSFTCAPARVRSSFLV